MREEKKEKKENVQPKKSSVEEEIGDLSPVENHIALEFLAEVTEQMGLSLDITAKEGGESLYIDIQGKDSGTIIGKRGQTLDAIQYLCSLVANKSSENYVRIVIDAENYRERREDALVTLAKRTAQKATKYKKNMIIEPKNPYERRIIHGALTNYHNIKTESVGQGKDRRLTIYYVEE